jgi:hypothetical protein
MEEVEQASVVRFFSCGSHTSIPPASSGEFQAVVSTQRQLATILGISTHAWMRQDGDRPAFGKYPFGFCEHPSSLPGLVHQGCGERRYAPAWAPSGHGDGLVCLLVPRAVHARRKVRMPQAARLAARQRSRSRLGPPSAMQPARACCPTRGTTGQRPVRTDPAGPTRSVASGASRFILGR